MQRPDLDLRMPKTPHMANRNHNVEQDANSSTTARTLCGVTTQLVEAVIALLGASRRSLT